MKIKSLIVTFSMKVKELARFFVHVVFILSITLGVEDTIKNVPLFNINILSQITDIMSKQYEVSSEI